MRPSSLLSFVGVSVAPTLARPAETPTQSTKTAQFTVPSEADWGQPVIANVRDEQAINAQDVCQGYKAENVQTSEFGIIAELSLIGSACNVYGNDIEHLILEVEYQSADRLNVKILPRDIGLDNWTWFVLPDDIVAPPVLDQDFELNVEDGVPTNTDILFEWDNEQSFNFRVVRVSTGDVLFDTKGWALVFEDQFIEFGTHMPSEYNIYGLGEVVHTFKISNNHTRTLYAADTADPIDRNAYGVHPFYLDTRYFTATKNGKLEYVPATKAIDKSVEYLSYSHGVYQRNAHGHELIMRPNDITWRSIGGSIDLYFFAGPTQSAVTKQYTTSAVGLPAMQQYWTFGFHQCRWGYTGWEEMQQLANDAAKFKIPVETFWADIDYMERYKNFANDPVNWSYDKGAEYLDWLHKNNMHFVPIVDSAIYIPNPDNPEDAYETFDRGMTANAFLKNPDGTLYIGAVWPGYTVFPDWVGASLNGTGTNVWWADELKRWHEKVQFDGIWIDMNEVSSFCVGSCGTGNVTINPVHVPFKLPGEPGAEVTDYPEDYAFANATEASLSLTATTSSFTKEMRVTTSSTTATKVAEITGSASISGNTTATTTKDSEETMETGSEEKAEGTFIGFDGKLRTNPTPGGRNVNWPPYQIDHIHGDLGVHAVSPNATSHGGYQQYDFHSLFGHQILNATYHGLLAIQPDKRPFIIGRSTFPGSGKWAGHWGGDNFSKWQYMALSIPQMLTFQLSGIPLFGADACGFIGNSDMTLCTRWMELAAFTPFYRNHNILSANSQEPWVWATTAEATRIAIGIRYQLLPYWYTLFYKAHTQGDTVMRALAWEFPNEPWLADAERQFLIGPAVLVTPVLTPGADTVNGVFPGVSPNDGEKGEVWYDWYNQTAISSNVQRGENVTIDAPLTHIPIHLRGGYIIPIQEAKMTTAEGRNSSWSLLVPLNKMGAARGELYIDDGVSLEPKEATVVQFTADRGTLTARPNGNYGIGQPLANVTVMGVQEKLITTVNFHGTVLNEDQWFFNADDALLKIFGLGQLTADGAFTMDWEITWN